MHLRHLPLNLLFFFLFFVPPLFADEAEAPPPQVNQEAPSTPQVSQEPPPFAEFLSEEKKEPAQYDFWSEFMNMLSALTLIILLMLVAAWVLKRLMNQRVALVNQNSSIKILDCRSVSPKCNVYILDILGRGLVIAETAQGVSTLLELPEGSDLSEVGNQGTSSFASLMQKKSTNQGDTP